MDFLENELVGFDENVGLTVLWCDLIATMCEVAITPGAFVCKRHQQTFSWSPVGKYMPD